MKTRLFSIFLMAACFCGGAFGQTPAKEKKAEPIEKPAAEPEVKVPRGVDPKLVSADPEYGYKKEKPIEVGGKTEEDGPEAEREYFSKLRDSEGRPVKFERLGSFGGGKDGHILDGYEVVSQDGKKVILYIDMYHFKNPPKKQPAPKGFFKAK